MDRMQIALKLGMDLLEIPIKVSNYRNICDAVYLSESYGVHIAPSRVIYDKERRIVYSPLSHEIGGVPPSNLFSDVNDIESSLRTGFDESKQYSLDNGSIQKLNHLKVDIKSKGIENLLLDTSNC